MSEERISLERFARSTMKDMGEPITGAVFNAYVPQRSVDMDAVERVLGNCHQFCSRQRKS